MAMLVTASHQESRSVPAVADAPDAVSRTMKAGVPASLAGNLIDASVNR